METKQFWKKDVMYHPAGGESRLLDGRPYDSC